MHPDLAYIPSEQSCAERLEILKNSINSTQGCLLELGANIGYFTINFENEGFDCIAIENSPAYLFCLRGLKKSLQKKFTIIDKSFLESKEIHETSFDIVLALNLFHHFLRREDDFNKLNMFLENLRCNEMYFESHNFDDPQLKNAYINMREDEFADYVRIKLRLSNYETIGSASDGRPLYKIS